MGITRDSKSEENLNFIFSVSVFSRLFLTTPARFLEILCPNLPKKAWGEFVRLTLTSAGNMIGASDL